MELLTSAWTSFTASVGLPNYSATASDYYSSIDANATNDDLKGQLQTLITSNKTVLSYDDVWTAFASVD